MFLVGAKMQNTRESNMCTPAASKLERPFSKTTSCCVPSHTKACSTASMADKTDSCTTRQTLVLVCVEILWWLSSLAIDTECQANSVGSMTLSKYMKTEPMAAVCIPLPVRLLMSLCESVST